MLPQDIDRDSALAYHQRAPAGKVAIVPTKPLRNAGDLSLAYTPGVAAVCEAIAQDPAYAYESTAKGNLVGIITNGSALLGLGNLGPLAAKPVMEGKAVLMKQFAGVDAFDIEVNIQDPSQLITVVRAIAPTFGAILLEDIKAPDCFVIEKRLQKELEIPVFHDDQHGTSVVVAAALENALLLANKCLSKVRVVINGAGAGALATAHLLCSAGLPIANLWVFDSRGLIYQGREGITPYKAPFAQACPPCTLTEALKDADVFIGLSVAGALPPAALQGMASDPIVFALANPIPEIDYEQAHRLRSDIIMGTGRSDFPNQVNNVLAYPYILRGALDMRATRITPAMLRAAATALAAVARGGSATPPERTALLPSPFDEHILPRVTKAIARAARKDGVAQKSMV